VACTGDPGNTAALASVQPQSFVTEFPIIENTKDLSLFPNNEFSAANIH
jgi:hypothetical protein